MRAMPGLAARIYVLILVALLPAMALALYTGVEQRRWAARDAQTDAMRVVDLMADQEERLIAGARQLLEQLAAEPAVQRHTDAGCDEYLAGLLPELPSYLNFGVLRVPDGFITCSALPMDRPVYSPDRLWFREAVRTKDFAVGEYQIGRITKRSSVNFGYPIFGPGGQVAAVVFSAFDISWFLDATRAAQLPPGSTLTVFDHQGVVLARHPEDAAWVGQEVDEAPLSQAVVGSTEGATAEATGLDGVRRLYAYRPLRHAGGGAPVYVAVGIPASIAYAQANRILVRNLLLLALVGVAAGVLAWLGGHLFIVRQVQQLVGAARRLAAGDLDARTGLPHTRGELGALAASFDDMARAVQTREAETRAAQAALATLNAELEQRVADRTHALEEVNAELDRFAYTVSHDLRAPLRAMHGFSQALVEDYGDRLEPTAREYATRVAQAAQRMDTLIQDLLAYSRVCRAEVEVAPLSLAGAVDEARTQVAADLAARQAEVRIHPALPMAVGHRAMLVQVVANLLTNGAKFVAPGVTPCLEIGAEVRNGAVRLWVQDNGIGIAREHQERIFAPFERLHSVEQFTGTGMGLAIVRRAVERMGGRVGVESEVGRGSRFWCELPTGEGG